MTIERNFDISLIAGLAFREKQIQQNYRPIIAVHKWFARRPGTLFRGLLLAEFGSTPLRETFFSSNNLRGIRIVDPFMGGGTPIIEANRLGCDVVGYDINPMAYWIVQRELDQLDLENYRRSSDGLIQRLEDEIGDFYNTRCLKCNKIDASVKYFLWVKTKECESCNSTIDLFPGYLIAKNQRHPKNVVVCGQCGDLNEIDDREKPGACNSCGDVLVIAGPARRNQCRCPRCGTSNAYPNSPSEPLRHRMFAIEYHCSSCKPLHKGRFFKKPDREDLTRFDDAYLRWNQLKPEFVPDDRIPPGDETDRLHRWGYKNYHQMLNARQLLGMELSCRAIVEQEDDDVRNALATNLSDLLRYQNMLCRYDTMALKSLDIFSIHGFPVGLIQCESNFIGISNNRNGNVGSGGWRNIIRKYEKAKKYCEEPFEIRYKNGSKVQVPTPGEWIGKSRDGISVADHRKIELYCRDATNTDLPENSFDAVLTDPPYFGNVQYAELMDFCYVWLRRLVNRGCLVNRDSAPFSKTSTRHARELTGNATQGRGLDEFLEGLSRTFRRMAFALKEGSPLVFTFHHNKLETYHPVAAAILDAKLTCSASIPCPAEMSGSIHISNTSSSIIDTVFVCRSTGSVPRRWIVGTPGDLARLIEEDIHQIRCAGVRLTRGDVRCMTFGHLIRLAIWKLRAAWDVSCSAVEKRKIVAETIEDLGGVSAVEECLAANVADLAEVRGQSFREEQTKFGEHDEISF